MGMVGTISFPGLGINNININPTAFKVFGHPVAWYGIIIACGLLLALIYGMKRAKVFNVTVDDLSDIVIFSLIFGVIGARLYYVLFYPTTYGTNPYFENPVSILYIWNGGLGIYGGIIAAFLTAFIITRIKKISAGAVFDIAGLGFLIGQAIGRWGNFINEEAYGSTTNLPWRMAISGETSPVHPCFLYESLWCIIGFIILHIYSKRRKFNGEVFLMYIMWYSFGRFFIEGLRTDSLMIGNIKISQLVAVILFVAAGGLLIYKRNSVRRRTTDATAEYAPLFEDTSKAVEADTAEEMKNYGIDSGDSENSENAEEQDAADSGATAGEENDVPDSAADDSLAENKSGDSEDSDADDNDTGEDK